MPSVILRDVTENESNTIREALSRSRENGSDTMLISFVRALILLLTVILSLRVMGKRQMGQLQPGELVITILLSDIIANPMQDNDIPMLNTVVAVLVLVGVELLFSVLSLKLPTLRRLLEGNPVILVRDGVPDQKQMRRLRYSMDDLLEGLRAKDVFDISEVAVAIAETDGSLNVLLKRESQPLTCKDAGLKIPETSMPAALVTDGVVSRQGARQLGLSEGELTRILKRQGTPVERIFLLTADKAGNTVLIKKEGTG